MKKPYTFRTVIVILIVAATLAAALIFSSSCAGVNQANLRIEDRESARLIQQGARLYDKARYQAALAKFAEAEDKSASPADKARIGEILSKAGYALYEKKLYSDSLLYYEVAAAIQEQSGNKTALIETLSYIGKIYSDTGRYSDAVSSFTKALDIQEELDDKAGISHNLNNLANLHSYLGGYDDSINLLNRALKICKESNNPNQTARTLTNLATIRYRLRNYKTALEHLAEALDTAKEDSLRATILSLIGIIHRFQGNFAEAEANYLQALEINRKSGNKSETATTLSILGELYKNEGRYDEAIAYFNEALSIAEAENDPLMIAVNLNYIGEAKFGEGKFDESLKLYEASLRKFEELGFKDRIARSFNNIGYLKGETGDYSSAFANFDKALAIYRELGDREWIRGALFGKGVYSERSGDIASAEADYKEAVEVFESIRRDVAGGDVAEQLFSDVNVKIYEKLVSLLIKQGKVEEALDYVQRSRSKSLMENLLNDSESLGDDVRGGSIKRYDKLTKAEASIAAELSRENGKPDRSTRKIENLSRALSANSTALREATATLKQKFPKMRAALEPSAKKPLSKGAVIPVNFVIIQYFIAEDETFIFTVGKDGIRAKAVAVKKKYLHTAVTEFRRLVYESSALGREKLNLASANALARRKQLDALSLELYEYLIKPAAGDILHADTVALAPFGILNYLPFQALSEKTADGRREFFIEQKRIVYLTAVADAEKIPKRRSAETVIAFGNPDVGKPELALPYSEIEALAIKSIFPSANLFLKSEATKGNFTANWGKYSLVHLSAHGILSDEGQYILLAPSVENKLTATDILALAPDEEVRAVVLSACSTAVDPFQANPAGAELATLAYAFELIEVPSVIATLWDISDRGTADLMRDFYANLKRGDTLEDAFRKAQIEMIRRGGKHAHPYYWAPFVVFAAYR